MNSLDPIAMLEAEHRVILKVVGAMAVMADVIEAGQDKRQPMENVLEFLQAYVGQGHHVKEEQHVFPSLAARGVPAQGCPIGALVHEHQKLHALVEELSQAAATAAQASPASACDNRPLPAGVGRRISGAHLEGGLPSVPDEPKGPPARGPRRAGVEVPPGG